MEYRAVNGPVYCRYAITPPVINSSKAFEVGVLAATTVDLQVGGNVPLKEGSNVKLRMILDNHTKRMTCHAKIDRISKDESTGKYEVASGQLSLSDEEFQQLSKSFISQPEHPVEWTEHVRPKGAHVSPVTLDQKSQEVTRDKAVTMPVSLIEEIDARRGAVPFSEFVITALRTYLKE
jgi:hypothetical protein